MTRPNMHSPPSGCFPFLACSPRIIAPFLHLLNYNCTTNLTPHMGLSITDTLHTSQPPAQPVTPPLHASAVYRRTPIDDSITTTQLLLSIDACFLTPLYDFDPTLQLAHLRP